MLSAPVRTLKFLLIAALVFEVFYLIAGNAFLNSPLAFKVINRKPEKYSIHWDAAFTLWPGAVRVYGVKTGGQSKKLQWYATVDKVDAWCRVIPLFWRTVDVLVVRTEGIDYRQRRRLDIFPAWSGAAPGMPPIPGLVNPPDPPPELLYPPKPKRAPWTVILRDVRGDDIRDIWIDSYRYLGRSSVETEMYLKVRGELGFPKIHLKTHHGKVEVEGNDPFREMELDLDIVIDRFIPRETKGVKFFEYLSGSIKLDMQTDHVHFLQPYFQRHDWVQMNSRGVVHADLTLDHGAFQPGSEFEVIPERIDLVVIDREGSGDGSVRAWVEEVDGETVSHIVVRIDEFDVAIEGDDKPFAFGEDLVFKMVGHDGNLANPFQTAELSVDMPDFEIPDLSVFNRYIPESTPIEIISGAGRMSYHFTATHELGSLGGRLELEVLGAEARGEKLDFKGNIRITTLLQNGSARERKFDISGTKIEIGNVQLTEKGEVAEEEWWMILKLPEARMVFSSPSDIRTLVDIDMKDTRPIVALLDAKKELSGIAKRLMTIDHVAVDAYVDVDRSGVDIRDLVVTGDRLRMMGDISIKDKRRDALMYVHLGMFRIGLEIDDGKKDLKFLRPLKWFEKKRALARAGKTESAFDGAAAASAEAIEAEAADASGADGDAADTASPR